MKNIKLNSELDEFMEQDKLSDQKIKELLFLKSFIDRLATKPHISSEKLKEIKEKFGLLPNVITWGDYFQTEVATTHWMKTDHQFHLIIQTIIYDIIISIMIFSNKNHDFWEKNYAPQLLSMGKGIENMPDQLTEEETHHFDILFGYFDEMGLDISKLTQEDFSFFSQFKLDSQAS